jgi:hypothetical protein
VSLALACRAQHFGNRYNKRHYAQLYRIHLRQIVEEDVRMG